MKRAAWLLVAFLFFKADKTEAQVPQGIPYQAVTRNASGQPLDSRPLKVRFSVVDSIALGTAVYVESHSTTTNSLGLFSVNVGMGTPTNGNFSGINWGLNSKFLKVELDTTASGNNYVDLGTQQMMSVPYALHAESSSTISGVGSEGQVLTTCNGVPVWTNGGQCPGRINSLNCLTATNSGTLTSGTAASGVSSSISYTGGNGGPFASQSISSTGVTGLTASLSSGSFVNGSGALIFNITGTPSSSGIASFSISIGGQSCLLSISVAGGPVTGISSATCGATNVHNPALAYGSMTDQDGNVYKTIIIGNQEWMAENLKVSHYRNGDYIPLITDASTWIGLNSGASCWYNNDSSSYSCPYGKLYNFYTVVDARNLCPSGWYVPTDADWNQMVQYLDSGANLNCTSCSQSTIAGDQLKSSGNGYWTSPRSNAINSTGFSGLPSGERSYNGQFNQLSIHGNWWSSTSDSLSPSAYSRRLVHYAENIDRNLTLKIEASAVRCIKTNNSSLGTYIGSLDCGNPTITGTLSAGVSSSGVTCSIQYTGGNGGPYAAQSIASTGVTGLTATLSAGTLANGSGSLNYTISGTPSAAGTASFAIAIGGQSCSLTLTVASGLVSGISSATCGATNVHNPAKAYGSMTDQDGNVYKTIVIGTQEWMAENLKASHYRNGDIIPLVTDNAVWGGLTTEATCWYNNDSATYSCPYGKLYNWYAVADARNLCPIGWHVPSDPDWNIFIKYIDPLSDTSVYGVQSYLVAYLKSSDTQWWTSGMTANNSSGFSALPSGRRSSNTGTYYFIGTRSYYFSSTDEYSYDAYGTDVAWGRLIDFQGGNNITYTFPDGNFVRYPIAKNAACAVRCIKD